MSLSDKRKQFFQIRAKCQVLVKKHAYADYPKRGFTANEIINLVRYKSGRFADNDSSDAIEGSYLFFVKDDLDRACKLVILIEETEVTDEKTGITRKEAVVVCSAYRDTEGEKS